jgi:hypothetical protein
MVPTISDATLTKDIRNAFRESAPLNTSLQHGVSDVICPKIRKRMRDTLAKSRVLARYVRNSKRDGFTATDVAMVDYIRGLCDLQALRYRLNGDTSTYLDFFGRKDPSKGRCDLRNAKQRAVLRILGLDPAGRYSQGVRLKQ